MADIFCPKCGKKTDIFIDNVCQECFIENKKLIECPIVIHSKVCSTCGSFFRKGKWKFNEDETEVALNSVNDALKIDKQVNIKDLILMPEQLDRSRYKVHVKIKGEIKGAEIEDEVDTEVRIKRESCDTCSRIAGGYFEGIVQIRADNRFPSPEELERCKTIAYDISSRSQEKGDRLAFISKTLELDEGIDLYVGLTKLGKQICRAIIEIYGGSVSESPRLIGMKDGVEIHRITFALRLPEFVRGDILNMKHRVIEVQSYGKHISGIDLETGKRFMENPDKLESVEKLGRRSDAVSTVFVSEEGNTIQVLDPETYESVTVKKPEFLKVKAGAEIKVIKTPVGIYILP